MCFICSTQWRAVYSGSTYRHGKCCGVNSEPIYHQFYVFSTCRVLSSPISHYNYITLMSYFASTLYSYSKAEHLSEVSATSSSCPSYSSGYILAIIPTGYWPVITFYLIISYCNFCVLYYTCYFPCILLDCIITFALYHYTASIPAKTC